MSFGGGTRYDDYPCFHQVMAEDSARTVVASLFDSVLPLVPELPTRPEAAGFAAPDRHLLPHDPMNVWFVARKA